MDPFEIIINKFILGKPTYELYRRKKQTKYGRINIRKLLLYVFPLQFFRIFKKKAAAIKIIS